MEESAIEQSLREAARAIASADALLIGAGAGMGVDSGLPDFRGNEGFWKAYPPFRGRSFSSMSTPHWFRSDPALAWGFFGHRLHLYRDTNPHGGFEILRRWGERMPRGYFVFTSNVDGQFQRAGFPEDRVLECHGSIHFLQCAGGCSDATWSADGLELDVDAETIRCRSELPACRRCGGIARPNILMFGDFDWLDSRRQEQQARYENWLREIEGARIVAIELGAGLAIPTVRDECEYQADTLVRINPREASAGPRGISVWAGAREALTKLDKHLRQDQYRIG